MRITIFSQLYVLFGIYRFKKMQSNANYVLIKSILNELRKNIVRFPITS